MSLHPLFGTALPRAWFAGRVDDIRSPEAHSCVAGPFGSDISAKYFVDEGVPVIRGSNLRTDLTRFVADGFVYVSAERAQKYQPQTVRAGDLVITCWGTIGQVGLVPGNGPFDQYVISNKQLKLRVDRNRLDPLYLFYYLACPAMVAFVNGRAKGAAVPGISLGILKSLPVVVPPLPSQRRIAAVLSAYDDLVENNQNRIRVLGEMARSFFRQVSSRSVTASAASAASRTAPLGDIASFDKESMSPQNAPDVTFDLYSFAACDDGRLPHPTRGSDIQSSKFRVPSGAVLLPKLNPHIARTWLPFLEGDRPAICSTEFLTLVPRGDLPRSFLYAVLEGEEFQRAVAVRADGTSNSHKRLKPDDVMNQRVVLPDPMRIQQFAALADPIYEQCHVLRKSIQTLRATRDLLLPRLLSGELDVSRVPDPAELTPESPP